MTGVAAAQNAGSTIHHYFSLTTEGEPNAFSSTSGKTKIASMQILVIDEAMMAESEIMFIIKERMCEVPLKESLRRPGALPDWGYRDILVCGDIRQLPPASGKQPFWGTKTFQEGFEIFALTEDRGHERDLHMQKLKELFAWGGCEPSHDTTVDSDLSNPWIVHEQVFAFVEEAYLRGWGLTGNNVDLDRGTALFAKRADVRNWNEACIA